MDYYFENRNESTGNEINRNLIMSKFLHRFLIVFNCLGTLITDLFG